MKFTKKELSANKHTRYLFALGKSEAEILLALLANAYRCTPRTVLTRTTVTRINSMKREIGKALKEMEYHPEDDYAIAHNKLK